MDAAGRIERCNSFLHRGNDMTDYRKLYREGAMLLLCCCGDPDYQMTDADIDLIAQLRAIPKPGGPKPGSGRKPNRQKESG